LIDWEEISAMFASMEEQARDLLLGTGAFPEDIGIERSADMRMYGQFHEVRVPLPAGPLNEAAVPEIRESFYRTYRSRYSYVNEDIELEFVDWHVTAAAQVLSVEIVGHSDSDGAELSEAMKGRRPAYFAQPATYVDCPVFDRYRLRPGMSFGGPAIIEERESTVVLQPGDYATVDRYLNLIVEVGA
jgi:N-methylhydantoinase A/oxoprolinase/acetone carboxylase beta subunit